MGSCQNVPGSDDAATTLMLISRAWKILAQGNHPGHLADFIISIGVGVAFSKFTTVNMVNILRNYKIDNMLRFSNEQFQSEKTCFAMKKTCLCELVKVILR